MATTDRRRVPVAPAPAIAAPKSRLAAAPVRLGGLSDMRAAQGFDFSHVAANAPPLLQRVAAVDAEAPGKANDRDSAAPASAGADAGAAAGTKDGAGAAKAPAAAKKTGCLTGCAQRWGKDTTCSKFGFKMGESEHAPHFVVDPSRKKKPFVPCCNSWPFALEKHARERLGLAGAASCPARHQKEVATVSLGDKSVDVLCSDTIPTSMVGERGAAHCTGKIAQEVIELSPQAMQDLSGQAANALHVSVCFGGAPQDGLCLSDAPNPKRSPEARDCITAGCSPDEGTPKLKEIPWRSS
jgi:hypothetical protein